MKRTGTAVKAGRRAVLTAAAVIFFAAAAVCALAAAGKLLEKRPDAPGAGGELTVMYFSVGRGDAALVTFPDGELMLIDAGTFDSGERLRAYFDFYRIKKIDYLIITHPHSDHYGGAGEIAKSVRFGDAFFSPAAPSSDEPAFLRLTETLEKQKCAITVPSPGDVLTAGGAEVRFLAPLSVCDDENGMSLAVRITYGDISFLFTGDAGADQEREMVERYGGDLRSDVLKLGHHGSATSSSEEFLAAVKPSFAVVSCEENSTYGHPSPEVLERLERNGAAVFAVYDSDIGLKFGTDGNNIYIFD